MVRIHIYEYMHCGNGPLCVGVHNLRTKIGFLECIYNGNRVRFPHTCYANPPPPPKKFEAHTKPSRPAPGIPNLVPFEAK